MIAVSELRELADDFEKEKRFKFFFTPIIKIVIPICRNRLLTEQVFMVQDKILRGKFT